jgi:hypothetical protein
MHRSPEAILAIVISSLALACGGTASGPVDATADVLEGSSEGSAEPPTDAGTEANDGAADAIDESFLAACPDCPASPPEAGAPCRGSASQEIDCEYGDDPRLVNALFRCVAGQWFYLAQVSAPVDSGLPTGDAGCPASYAAAQSATSCDPPSCVYPEGTCTCEVAVGNDSGTLWACTSVPLPPGCPASLEEAQSSATCPSNAVSCFYPGGTCTCFVSDAGAPWRCTVPEAGCPATRPRLGAPCDPTLPKHCMYVPIGCSFPTGDLSCSPSSCGNVWTSGPGAFCSK